MKIELKKIEHNERLSEETDCFSANLYIEGKLAGIASNAGHGGNTNYYGTSETGWELIRKAEEYCKTLPSEKHGDFKIKIDLEYYIDKLLSQYLRARFKKKMQGYFEQHIVISDNPEKGFNTVKLPKPISELLATRKTKPHFIGMLSRCRCDLKPGEKILNDNIPVEILQLTGFKEDQYMVQSPVSKKEKTKKQLKKRR